jgi:uridine kinase
MKQANTSQLVAIAGGSGSGKGWLVQQLRKLLGEKACHLSLDDFYRNRSHLPPSRRERVNFDVPGAIDWDCVERVLGDCRAGQTTRVPRYDFVTHCRLPDREAWLPKPLVLVEGLWLLWRSSVRPLFDLKIFLDCPARLRLQRRLGRDVAERGRSAADIRRQFRTVVAPMHRQYVKPQKCWADVILTQPFKEADLLHLADRLWTLLRTGSPAPSWMRKTFRVELLTLLQCHEHGG